ncbi:MAG: hypothetical protein KAJ35_04285 [Thermoplasmata archaeon]|nr:hypothetical protein [Thermoplasmata archaeon]
MVIGKRLSRESYKSLRVLLAANIAYHVGLFSILILLLPQGTCGTVQPMVVMTSIAPALDVEFFMGLFFLIEIVSLILFLILKNQLTAVLAIAVPWSFAILAVIDDPSSPLVVLFIPMPFIMGMYLPFWEYSVNDWIPINPLPGRLYRGPVR